MNMRLAEKIDSGKINLGVIGLGYVGLPLAVEFTNNDFKVTGIDISEEKVKRINQGQNYIKDVVDEDLNQAVTEGLLSATTDFAAVAELDAISICVPTPLRKTKDPDVSFIMAALDEIVKYMHKDLLVVLESTTYPGTTRELMLPKLEQSGLKVGKDFFLAFSPERVDPGNPVYKTKNTPKVIGGITSRCTQLAEQLYGKVIDTIVPVSSSEAAEMVKLLENTFRSINIGLANEMALMCDKLSIDVWDVIEAAATKPFGFMKFYPGPGLGGHCIPIDPYYLSWKMKTLDYRARFIELAGEINAEMPEYVVRLLTDGLNYLKKAVNGTQILILGVAYKSDIDDVRESPALDIMKLLEQKGAQIHFSDPYVRSINWNGTTMESEPLRQELLQTMDAVMIVSGHKGIDYESVQRNAKLVVDTRNVIKGNFKNVLKLGAR